MITLGENNIGSVYLGTNSIGKIYLGSDLVFQKGGHTSKISYIRGGGDGSYIDTGITADSTTKIIVYARNWNPHSSFLFGSRTSIGVDGFSISTNTGEETGDIRIGYAQTNDTFAYDQFINLSHYHKYELYQGVLKIDDTTVASAVHNVFSNNYNIHLFGNNNGGTHMNASLPIDICSVQIYKGGVLVRDFIPRKKPYIGLYDTVSQTLFTNAGSGLLSYGTFYPDAYTPLEYVSCTGEQYFDTGILGTNSLNFVCKIMPNVVSDYSMVFGCQTTVSSKRYGFLFGNDLTKGSHIYFLYADGSEGYNNTTTLNGYDYKAQKRWNAFSFYSGSNVITQKTPTVSSYTTDYNIYVGARNNAGIADLPFEGRLYYIGFGSSRSLVPANVGGVAGMYDTYNDVFYSSSSGTNFIAGQ